MKPLMFVVMYAKQCVYNLYYVLRLLAVFYLFSSSRASPTCSC